jgi:uncharacterized protein YceK
LRIKGTKQKTKNTIMKKLLLLAVAIVFMAGCGGVSHVTGGHHGAMKKEGNKAAKTSQKHSRAQFPM